MRFEWDLTKARANLRAHGVGFAEATTVLEDDFALTRNDPDALDEQRFVSLGLSDLGKLLVVVYTYREPDTIRWPRRGRRTDVKGCNMRKIVAEKCRDFDFSGARRGAVVKLEPGKTKISIRLDNAVLEYFRNIVDKAGGGNYQTLINDALLEFVHRRSTLEIVREVVREELAPYRAGRKSGSSMKSPVKKDRRRSNTRSGS